MLKSRYFLEDKTVPRYIVNTRDSEDQIKYQVDLKYFSACGTPTMILLIEAARKLLPGVGLAGARK